MLICSSVQRWGEERPVIIDDVVQIFRADDHVQHCGGNLPLHHDLQYTLALLDGFKGASRKNVASEKASSSNTLHCDGVLSQTKSTFPSGSVTEQHGF